MSKQILEGTWIALKGALQEKWGEVTSDDKAIVEGMELRLEGLLQIREAQNSDRQPTQQRGL